MNRPPILYAEDEETDAFLMERAFKQAAISHPLFIVPNGQRVIDYLSGTGEFANRDRFPLPRLILLDINLPIRSGLEILQWIRSQPSVQTLPVLVITASSLHSDIYRAYLWGANGYLLKPGRLEELVTMARAIADFWITYNLVVNQAPGPESTKR